MSAILDLTMPRKIARRITAQYLHNAALFYLERYASSSGRLRQVLIRKVKRSCMDHPDQDESALLPLVDQEIEKLVRIEVLRDDLLLTQLVDGYRGRGMATRMIENKLKLKGFSPPQIASAMARSHSAETGDQECDAAIRYLQRRRLWPFARVMPPDSDRAARAKLHQKSWAALARQGYDPDVINRAFKSVQGMD